MTAPDDILRRLPDAIRERAEREMAQARHAARYDDRAQGTAADAAAAVLARYAAAADEADRAAEKAAGAEPGRDARWHLAGHARAAFWAQWEAQSKPVERVTAEDLAEVSDWWVEDGCVLAHNDDATDTEFATVRIVARPDREADARLILRLAAEVTALRAERDGWSREATLVVNDAKKELAAWKAEAATQADRADALRAELSATRDRVERTSGEAFKAESERDDARARLESLRGKVRAVSERLGRVSLAWDADDMYAEVNTCAALLSDVEGKPVERTPETVLRAMLRAYEAAALEQEMRRSHGLPPRRYTEEIQCIREYLADLVVTGAEPFAYGRTPPLARDYEARLRGDRPLDAPPAEV